jgi:hypothetical protein
MLPIAPQITAWISPLWIAAASAALLVLIIYVLAFRPKPKGAASAAGRVPLILLVAVLGGALVWAFLDNGVERSQEAERSALELRAGQLTVRTLTPGSPLSCLDALAGDAIQAACERAVFDSPANVASAISYVAAQFTLLSDMTEYVRRGGVHLDGALLALQRSLEADPFGFLAQVLVVRDGCTAENCAALTLLPDPSHVRTNIIAQTLHQYIDHYKDVWARSADAPLADAGGPLPGLAENVPGKHKVDIDFPSAASIPPISIMNPEPKRDAAAEPARKRESAAQTDPVWRPAPSPAAQSHPAAQ